MNKLALLPYFTTFQLRIYEFPVKKEPDSPSTLGQMMGARCLHPLFERLFRFKMADEDFKFLR